MPTTCWVNKLPLMALLAVFGVVGISPVSASAELAAVHNRYGVLNLPMLDGTDYTLESFAESDGLLYDRSKHRIKGVEFVSLFQVLPSNPDNPMGFCGTGNEVWLHVYRVAGVTLAKVVKMLVSSCLSSISMASQNSGEATQDDNFSSLRWSDCGFSIDWFTYVDAAGRSLKRSDFVLQGGLFLQKDIEFEDIQRESISNQ